MNCFMCELSYTFLKPQSFYVKLNCCLMKENSLTNRIYIQCKYIYLLPYIIFYMDNYQTHPPIYIKYTFFVLIAF